jgi:TctA family transporter
MLYALGLFAWIMKQIGWPRAPMLIGFVLSTATERFLWISHGLYGWQFLLKPSVLALGSLVLITLFAGFRFKKSINAKVGVAGDLAKAKASGAAPSDASGTGR